MHFFLLFFLVFGEFFHQSLMTFVATPPMGWNSWNQFQCSVDEKLVREIADQLVETGLRDLGYRYVNIDDCWQAKERDANGRLVPDPQKFPSGINNLADYVHKKGLKLGIYTDVGSKTCAGRPGSFGHFKVDADTFAEWGIDYLKMDFCHLYIDELIEPWIYYTNMSNQLERSGRNITFSICEWGFQKPWLWAPKISNLWRISLDIWPWWHRVLQIIDDSKLLYPYVSQSHYNDLDMLEVGVNGTFFNKESFPPCSLTKRECKTHFSFWSILSSPLLLGNDLRNMPSWVFEIIANKEIIDVNQNSLIEQGKLIYSESKGIQVDGICLAGNCKNIEIWGRNITGALVVILFNRADPFDQNSTSFQSENITLHWEDLNLPSNQMMEIRDLWKHENLGRFASKFTALVEPHGVVVIKLTATTTTN